MDHDHDEGSWPLLLGSAILCGLATVAGIIAQRFPGTENITLGIYLIAYMTGGWDAALDTLEKLRKLRLDIHFLMIAVAVGAAFIDAWWEGAALLFLFSLSGALEAMAMARTEREIRSLFHEAPKKALFIQDDDSTKEVSVSSLRVGEKIRILPGEQFPTDSRVIAGESSADESSLTGESMPVDKRSGDPVFSGTINTWGRLDAEVEKEAGDSAHARIINLITEAQKSKAPSQRFTDKFGTAYTIGILLLSLGMFFVWHYGMNLPAFLSVEGEKSAFYRAMTLLVVCSPCALVISIPSAILAGIASGARRGVLFRGGIAVENLADITRLAMDKTGTLTKGELEDATRFFRHAVAAGPRNPVAHANLGSVLLRRSRPAEAADAYEEATQIAPGMPAAWRGLGHALWKIGDSEGALQALLRARSLAPDDERTQELLRLVEAQTR